MEGMTNALQQHLSLRAEAQSLRLLRSSCPSQVSLQPLRRGHEDPVPNFVWITPGLATMARLLHATGDRSWHKTSPDLATDAWKNNGLLPSPGTGAMRDNHVLTLAIQPNPIESSSAHAYTAYYLCLATGSEDLPALPRRLGRAADASAMMTCQDPALRPPSADQARGPRRKTTRRVARIGTPRPLSPPATHLMTGDVEVAEQEIGSLWGHLDQKSMW